MPDLGDTVQLTAANLDGDGNPAAVEHGPVLTVTLPDGSAVLPVVVADVLGQWHAEFVTTQAGRHVARWAGTGVGAFAYVEAFSVSAVDPGYLFGLDDAKTALGITWAQSAARDAQLRDFIAATTSVIEDIVGPIVPRAVEEWCDGGGGSIVLAQTPVLSITSVTESYGSNFRTLTEQALDGGAGFSSYGYTIDLPTGVLRRRTSGQASTFAFGRRNVHVAYVAGQVPAANVVLAAKEQLRFLWETSVQGNRPSFGSDDESQDFAPSGFAVPRRVIELCAGSRRVPGIA